jgi:hypothetical protein
MYPIPQVLNTPDDAVDDEPPPPLINIVGPVLVIRFMKDAGHHRVGHGDDGPRLSTACGKAPIQRREIGALGMHGRMRQLGQDRPEGTVPLAGFICAVRWYLRYALSSRDVEKLLQERGVQVDHTMGFRWVQRYAPELDKRCRLQLKATNDPC